MAILFAREGADVTIVHLPSEQKDADSTVAAIEKEGRKALSIASRYALVRTQFRRPGLGSEVPLLDYRPTSTSCCPTSREPTPTVSPSTR